MGQWGTLKVGGLAHYWIANADGKCQAPCGLKAHTQGVMPEQTQPRRCFRCAKLAPKQQERLQGELGLLQDIFGPDHVFIIDENTDLDQLPKLNGL